MTHFTSAINDMGYRFDEALEELKSGLVADILDEAVNAVDDMIFYSVDAFDNYSDLTPDTAYRKVMDTPAIVEAIRKAVREYPTLVYSKVLEAKEVLPSRVLCYFPHNEFESVMLDSIKNLPKFNAYSPIGTKLARYDLPNEIKWAIEEAIEDVANG